jgi:uncharacterized membrane protein (UPF0127 family)
MRFIRLLPVVFLALGLVCFYALPGFALDAFERSTLTLEKQDGTRLTFVIEIARTPDQMAQGLMYRQSLPEDAGMLFLYPEARPVAFWMRNTFIPLDLLFMDAHGKVIWIYKQAQPFDETHITPPDPAFAVLEINGGLSDQLDINLGDQLQFSAFQK